MAYPTNPIYKFYKDSFTNENCGIEKMNGTEKICIPFATGNTDYQEYLALAAEGNTAEAAD